MSVVEREAWLEERIIKMGVHFMFPELDFNSKEYEELLHYIRDEFERIQVVVLWRLDEELVKLVKKLRLQPIGKKEVIMTTNYVKVTEDDANYPRSIYQRSMGLKPRFR